MLIIIVQVEFMSGCVIMQFCVEILFNETMLCLWTEFRAGNCIMYMAGKL